MVDWFDGPVTAWPGSLTVGWSPQERRPGGQGFSVTPSP